MPAFDDGLAETEIPTGTVETDVRVRDRLTGAVYATRLSSGRVFCARDAVLRGQATPRLLDTPERLLSRRPAKTTRPR